MGPRRGPGMRGAGEKAKDFKSAIQRLVKELKRFKTLIIIAFVLSALSAILSILAPNQLSKLTDAIAKGLAVGSSMDMIAVRNVSLTLLFLYISSALFNYIQAISMTTVANRFAKILRSKISTKIN